MEDFMLKKIIVVLLFALAVVSCEQPTQEIIKEVTTINNVPIIWKGSLPSAPANPDIGWAYYDITDKCSYIWDGDSWEILAQDGVSIIWRGELPAAPSSPQLNWAYYNIIDGNSYIYNGSNWNLLAKAGRDGASGILLWIGALDSAPPNPSAGWAYYNSTDRISYIWNGNNWEILAKDGTDGIDGGDGTNGIGIIWQGTFSTQPASPQINWAYYNTIDNKSYIWNGSSWQIMAESGNANITVPISWKGSLTAAPLNPQIGWMYYNSILGKSYIWDGTAWEIVAQDGQDGQCGGTNPEGFLITWRGALANAPSNPQKGWAYYNTSQKKSFIWDGSSWQILAQDGADGTGGGGTVDQGPWLYVILNTSNRNYTQYAQTEMTTVDFGKVGIGSSSRSSTFYIGIMGGSGNTTLNLTGNPAIQITGLNANCFSVTQPSTTSTVTGTYIMDASISFTPDSLGIKTATITIPNNSSDKPDFSFTVRGEGSQWPKTFDSVEGDGDDRITCSVIDSQGNIYFIGYGFELVNHHSGYDWWIKKIDNSGNEVTSGWDKKLDFYDNYNAYYSNHDKPTNAIIDNSDNLIVSDGFTTIKFAPNGTVTWQKDIGGTLYNDSQNNVFIVTSSSIKKYNPAGTELWTKSYTGRLSFNSNNNIVVYNNNTLRYLAANGTEDWMQNIQENIQENNNTNIAANTWHNAIKTSGVDDYYRFSVASGTNYTVSWNDSYQGDSTKTADVYVTASWEDTNESIFTRTDSGWTTPRTFTANRTGNVIIRVDNSSGTYAIRINQMFSKINLNLNPFSINSATFDNIGSIYIAGHGNMLIDQHSGRDVWIKKYNSSGTEITTGWNKKVDWNTSDDEWATEIRFDGTNIIAIGQGNDIINGASKNDTWVKKFTTGGTELYSFVIPDDSANLVKIDNSENYYFSSGSSTSTLFRKYNTSGTLLFSFSWNSRLPYINHPLFIMDSSNSVYMYGYASNLVTSVSGNDWIIRKFNSSGNEL